MQEFALFTKFVALEKRRPTVPQKNQLYGIVYAQHLDQAS